MTYSQQVQNMCPITKGPKHGPAPIPEEGAWVKAYEIKDISALPISMEVYLARISATMSVPPVEAPMSNTMAAPSAGRKIGRAHV